MKRRQLLKHAGLATMIAAASVSTLGCAGPRRRRRRARRRAATRHVVVWGRRPGVIRLRRRAVAVGHFVQLPDGREGEVINITHSHVVINTDGKETRYEYEDLDE